MAKRYHAAIWLIVLVAISAEAMAQEFLTMRAGGVGYAPAAYAGTPRGRLMAERAAKVVAMRNLAVRQVRPPGRMFLRAYVPGVRTVTTVPTPDGGMAVTVETTFRIGRFRERYIEW